MSNFLNWLDQSPSATIITLFLLFCAGIALQHWKYRAILYATWLEYDAEKIRLRRMVDAAIEEVDAYASRVNGLARERDNLLQCNMELQQAIYRREQQIEKFIPYQVISSMMMWGKN